MMKKTLAALAVLALLAGCAHLPPPQPGPTPQMSPDGWDPE